MRDDLRNLRETAAGSQSPRSQADGNSLAAASLERQRGRGVAMDERPKWVPGRHSRVSRRLEKISDDMAEIKKGAKADEPPVVAQLRGEIVLLKRVPASKSRPRPKPPTRLDRRGVLDRGVLDRGVLDRGLESPPALERPTALLGGRPSRLSNPEPEAP